MAKHTIVKWFVWGLFAMIPGAILIPASAVAWAAHLETLNPGNTRGLLPDDFSRTMLILIAAGAGTAIIGLVAGFVAWIGALVNSHQLADKRWFKALLWCGLAGILTAPVFGLGGLIAGGALIAYLVGGPDAIGVPQSDDVAVSARSIVLRKATIASWFKWGWLSMGVGACLALVVSNLTDPGRILEGHTWTALVLLMACSVIAAGGIVAASVSWWGALFNAQRLIVKIWFNVLLWSGIASVVLMPLFGVGALITLGVGIAYLTAAPEGIAALSTDGKRLGVFLGSLPIANDASAG